MTLLTKSKYIIGLSCPKYLWMMFHELDKIPEPDLATEYIIQQGHIIGQLAKKLFPDGVDLPEDTKDFKINVQKTQELLKQRKIIFEAGIVAGELYARADILVPAGKNEWDIVEVKASTQVKDEHIHDVSFQKHVYQLAGLKIRKCFLLHINNEFVKKGEIKPKELLTQEEITTEVNEAINGIQDRINYMTEVVNNKEPPKVHIGNGCKNGLECVSEDCWNFLPEGHVFDLYYGGKKSLELLEAEIFSIKDIPDTFKLNEKQEIQRKCANTEKVHINKEGIKKFLKGLKYPLYYLDFETFQTAVPLYDGTKPYQQIPFQFSLHVDDGKKMRHFEYLHDSKDDPRKKFLQELKKVLGIEGSIIVFNQSFEIGRLKELAETFPEHKEWAESVIKRIVDLIVPFRNFDYYNPKQKGSCSIKDVLPAVVGKSYKDMNINNGGLASVSYFESVFNNVENKEQIRKDLLEYCKLDTEGMVWIVDELKKLV
ncbi:DUF2779 domain-containing protein [Candidatus Woesearchaeota archaeon]|nr:DUF2779 domain-containing protein [Candidatus Woesearchaeota archaeon]